jgi:ABC-type glycerol-3-phosphate transport system substrate-binding protein
LIAGCQPASSEIDAPSAPYRGMELRVACPDQATANLVSSFGQTWARRQGAKVAIVRYDRPEVELNAQSADVWIIPPADLPRLVADGKLAPLPEKYSKRENPYTWNDLLPSYREQLLRWESKPHGFVLVGESPLCCYRQDLFKDAAVQTAFRKKFHHKLDAPNTWEQFAWLADYFREHAPGGQAGPSLPPLPRADAALDRLFYTVAASYARRAVPADEAPAADHENNVFSFHYEVKTGKPRIAAPGFVHALKRLQDLQKCRPPEPADQPEEAFRAGRAVLCLTDAPWLKVFQKTPALRDKIGVCRIPGGEVYFDFAKGERHQTPEGNRVPYLGGAGWLAVVPSSNERAAAAFDLLAELSGSKTSTQIFLGQVGPGGPIRAEQLHRERWDAFDLDTARTLKLQEALRETLLHRNLKNPVLCLRTSRQASHRAVLVKEIRAALLENADAERTLQNVADAWRKLDREQGLDAHKADYRRNLGLDAK